MPCDGKIVVMKSGYEDLKTKVLVPSKTKTHASQQMNIVVMQVMMQDIKVFPDLLGFPCL